MASNQKYRDPPTDSDDDISDLWANPSETNLDMLEELSNTFYPGAYCNCVEKTQKACYEENILELWADQASPVTSYIEDFRGTFFTLLL